MTENNKCLVCTTPHREWIEEQSEEGRSARDLSKALKDKYNVDISHSSISNHLNKHMGGDKADIMAELEPRIRNLERWMSQALPGSSFVTWIPKFPGPGEAHHYDIRDRAAYLTTIPNPESLNAEVIAIRTSISTEMDRDEAERDRQQKEVWAQEKAARDRLAKLARDEEEAAQKKASEESKRIEIETMRKTVKEYDSRPKTI